jgi:hypothetical protein
LNGVLEVYGGGSLYTQWLASMMPALHVVADLYDALHIVAGLYAPLHVVADLYDALHVVAGLSDPLHVVADPYDARLNPQMIRAFGILKKAACTANLELKTLDPKIGDLIMV